MATPEGNTINGQYPLLCYRYDSENDEAKSSCLTLSRKYVTIFECSKNRKRTPCSVHINCKLYQIILPNTVKYYLR